MKTLAPHGGPNTMAREREREREREIHVLVPCVMHGADMYIFTPPAAEALCKRQLRIASKGMKTRGFQRYEDSARCQLSGDGDN